MDDFMLTLAAFYLLGINILAIVLVIYDKRASRRGSWRIKESTLMLVSALGGSLAMLISMRRVRHKTKHAKFMVGIPVMIMLQAAAVGLFLWWPER